MAESEKYEVLEKIGHGSFGIIRKVKRKQDGQILCRKEINYNRMSQKEREQLHAEFAILSSLKHPNIVGYYHREHLKTTQDLHLYMEYCGNGDLGRVIKDLQAKNQYAEESFVWSMFAQLVTALYRCHYGIDPPDIGSDVMGLENAVKPRAPTGGVMILHRDLKPENVFLGEDNSVKLGDFGLSKLMQSHDFASTYVGTPFYMSPEICAAERYTLKSDIWSLGCIIYELCTREPPFNAKTHFQLVQRIKEGKIAQIPSVYSPELMTIIKDCLKVNPDRRPDTAQLLNLPVVRLMRKEKEVVELSRLLKTKNETATARLLEADLRLKKIDEDKSQTRQEIEASVRREWEVKARLEIDRQVQLEIEKLQAQFSTEVQKETQKQVELELAKRSTEAQTRETKALPRLPPQDELPLSSVGTSGDGDFPSSTDLTDFSLLESPEPSKLLKKSVRTPFGRAQTMFVNTPMDVEMAEPSPISIASLSLSPRRNGGGKAPIAGKPVFAGGSGLERWRASTLLSESESEDEDTPVLPSPPSPTRQKLSSKNPFRSGGRPALISQRTAPMPRPGQTNIFAKPIAVPSLPPMTKQPEVRPGSSGLVSKQRAPSPNRRLTKIPSSSNLVASEVSTSPTRKGSLTRKPQAARSDPSDLNKLAIKNDMASKANVAPRGRTLVELAQARAGGRPVDANGNFEENGSPKGKRFADRMPQREAPTWNPEIDEMPSPFLVRSRQAVRRP